MLPESNIHPVLIVDDDHDVRTSLAEILADEGYPTATAANGAEALDLLRRGLEPAVILLDLRMPVMDGEAFCQIWRDDPSLAIIPVWIVSADATAAERSRRCGATGLLEKPLALDRLLDTVEQYAPRS